MKAIVTRYLGPTNHRGSRIKATVEGARPLTIPYDSGSGNPHRDAAEALRDRQGWSGALVEGALPNGDKVFVFGVAVC